METSSEQPTIITPACNTIEWYRPTLEQLPAPTVELLLQNTGLKSEDEVKDHIQNSRQSMADVNKTLLKTPQNWPPCFLAKATLISKSP